jgi:hypothetical protein
MELGSHRCDHRTIAYLIAFPEVITAIVNTTLIVRSGSTHSEWRAATFRRLPDLCPPTENRTSSDGEHTRHNIGSQGTAGRDKSS